jgi:hypothetical protein
MRTLLGLVAVGVVAAFAAFAIADDKVSQSKTILVDEGGSYDVPVHPDYVTVCYFPDEITKAVASDPKSYEIKSLGSTSLAIRPLKKDAKPANLAVATESIKVSVVLSIAKDRGDALTQVTFKRADVEAELRARIDDAVAERTAELEAQVAEMKRTMDAELPKVAETIIAQRVLARRELRKLDAIERNDDNVILRVQQAMYIGEDAYLVFEIQNRDRSPYRLASVKVLDGTDDKAGIVQFTSGAAEAISEGVIGVVGPRSRGTGVVVVRGVSAVIGKSLTVEVAEAKGRGKVAVGSVVLK